jgi:glycosidase
MASDDFSKDTIYFIVVDRFKDGDPANNPKTNIYSADKSEWKHYWGGDIQGIIDELPYIKSLGCTAIWITPIVENTESLYVYGEKKDEKITSYHGYWGSDYYRINPHFGTKEKFKELIQRAHAMDIKIIFDYVLNHTSPAGQGINGAIYKDGKFIADYSNDTKKWFHHNGSTDFRIADPAEWQNKNLFDLADLNSENPEVEKYLFDAAKMWMDMGIDSFRLDTVRHIPVGFAAQYLHIWRMVNGWTRCSRRCGFYQRNRHKYDRFHPHIQTYRCSLQKQIFHKPCGSF